MATVIGKPCVKCGSVERWGNGKCAPCTREANRIYREKNIDKARASCAKYRAANIEKERERNRKYAADNRERNKAATNKWRSENRDAVRRLAAKYYLIHGEKDRLRTRKGAITLKAHYVCGLLGVGVKDAPPELIEAKRQQLLTYRCIKQLQSTLKEKEKQ